ncbi:hypothetical protein KVV02_003819 [Mortierella alpina]|uniref:Transmembrane protein n=1 Tax=Mortierella alpina TaxID=64518 RepID=A0A9P8IF16_MORAP|nr:hypothetical protein KVV02_003819 [Mortierella alpina]
MWSPSFSTVRIIQRCILRLACGSACGSIILFVASFATGRSPTAIQFPRIFTTVGVAIFAYYKNSMSHDGRRLMVLCLSCFCAILFIFYAGRLISLAQTEHTFVLYLAGGVDVVIATLLLIDGVLVDLYSIHLNSIQATSSRNISTESSGNVHDALQEPLPVHMYQPRLSLAPSEETSSQSGTTVVPTSDDNEVVPQDNDAVELEELPKYERRRPTQHATIVDMTNLESVDATVLRLAVSISSLELDVTNNDGSGYEQGQELRWELGGRLSTVEAPEYSPSLEEAPAETASLLPSPAPTYDRIAPLASSRHSGSSVMLTSTLSETPAGPVTAAPPGGAPFITVTSAPPVYTP